MAVAETVSRTVSKVVDVPVEIRPAEMLRALTHEELRAECGRRGIALKSAGPGGRPSKHKIALSDLEEVHVLILRRNYRDALFVLEWALPKQFRGLASEIEMHFGGRA